MQTGSMGFSQIRIDADTKARGEHVFPSDFGHAGMLSVRLVRADIAHADILGIETQAAAALEGVACVLTHRDVPGRNGFGLMEADQPVLCDRRVKFAGDVVAVVAATTDEIAYRACRLVKPRFAPLAGIDSPGQALSGKEGNICAAVDLGFGDVEAVLARSAHVASLAYVTGRQEHAYLETEAGCAFFDGDGRLTIVAGGQNPHHDRQQVAEALGIAEHRIRVLNPPMGGAFGGKEDITVQIYLALVAVKTGMPCRMMFDRSDSIAYSVKRHPFAVSVTVGADARGNLTAFRAELTADTGAYLTLGPAVLTLAAEHCGGPYRFEASRIKGRVLHTNTGNASAFRGFGNPQVIIGIEQAMDILAGKCAKDPVSFRTRNLLRQGDRAAAGHRITSPVTLPALAEAARHGRIMSDPSAACAVSRPWLRRAIGLAFVWQGFGLGAGVESGATVKAARKADRRYELAVSAPDLGEGNMTAFAQIAADVLGCMPEEIDIVTGDSDFAKAGSTNASRSTMVIGSAVARACAMLRGRIDAGEGGELSETASYRPDLPDQVGSPGLPHAGYAYGVQVLVAEVDVMTGLTSIPQVETYLDAGRVINPDGVTGQIEGGFAQGLGFALCEDAKVARGLVLNDRLSTYIIPGIKDVPPRMETILINTPDPSNPLGVRGIAEIGLTPVAACVANAVAQITGRRSERFPITPENIVEAIMGDPA